MESVKTVFVNLKSYFFENDLDQEVLTEETKASIENTIKAIEPTKEYKTNYLNHHPDSISKDDFPSSENGPSTINQEDDCDGLPIPIEYDLKDSHFEEDNSTWNDYTKHGEWFINYLPPVQERYQRKCNRKDKNRRGRRKYNDRSFFMPNSNSCLDYNPYHQHHYYTRCSCSRKIKKF